MHIPDGFLDTKTVAVTSLMSVTALGIALRDLRKNVPRRQIPMMGLTAAFVFAAQMLNFPIGGGTSGHMVGSVLVAVLLGPSSAMIVMTSVLIVQAFLFADGGLTCLGANILNMAIVATAAGYALYTVIRRLWQSDRGTIMGATFSAWCATVIASIFCVGELASSGTIPWNAALPPMAIAHMVIGLGEATITALVLSAIVKIRPELIYGSPASGNRPHGRSLVPVGIIVVLALIFFVAPHASGLPDGLEKSAEFLGFSQRTIPHDAIVHEKNIFGIQSDPLSIAIAGSIGAVIAGTLSFGLANLLMREKTARQTS